AVSRSIGRLQFDPQRRQRTRVIHLDAVLRHLREAVDDRLQGTRIKVVAAQVDHVVGPAQNAARQADERPAARARFRGNTYQVAGAVTQERATPAAEVGQYQFADLPWGYGSPRLRVNHLNETLALQYMQTARVGVAFDAERSDFGQPAVVEDAGAPGALD